MTEEAMSIKVLTAALCLAATASCAPGADAAPEIVVDRTACSHCGMLISETVYAAAYKVEGKDARVFDDLGCLRNAFKQVLADRSAELEGAKVWVHDAGSGAWIDGRHAAFVSSKDIRTPMGGGALAYRSAADAERAAKTHHARTFDSFASFVAEGSLQ